VKRDQKGEIRKERSERRDQKGEIRKERSERRDQKGEIRKERSGFCGLQSPYGRGFVRPGHAPASLGPRSGLAAVY
jgi:hypothetical protein